MKSDARNVFTALDIEILNRGTVHPKFKFYLFSTHQCVDGDLMHITIPFHEGKKSHSCIHPVLIQWKPMVAVYSINQKANMSPNRS